MLTEGNILPFVSLSDVSARIKKGTGRNGSLLTVEGIARASHVPRFLTRHLDILHSQFSVSVKNYHGKLKTVEYDLFTMPGIVQSQIVRDLGKIDEFARKDIGKSLVEGRMQIGVVDKLRIGDDVLECTVAKISFIK